MKKKPQMWTMCKSDKETIDLGENTKMIIKWEVFTKEEQIVKPTTWNRIISFVKRIKLKNPINVTPKEKEIVEVEESKVTHDLATDDATDAIISKHVESLSKVKDEPIKPVTEETLCLDDIEKEVVLIEDDEQSIEPERPVVKEVPGKERRKNKQPPKSYITIAETAKLLHRSVVTVYILIKSRRLKTIGNNPKYVLRASVDEELKKQKPMKSGKTNEKARCCICCGVKYGARPRYAGSSRVYCDLCAERQAIATNDLQHYTTRLIKDLDVTIPLVEAAALLDISVSSLSKSVKNGLTYRSGKDGHILLVDVLERRKVRMDQDTLKKELLSGDIKVVTTSEARKQLGVTNRAIEYYLRSGKLKTYATNPLRIAQSEIDRFLKEREVVEVKESKVTHDRVVKEVPVKEQKQRNKKEQTITVRESEKLLNISQAKIYALIRQRKLKIVGKNPMRILKSSIDEFLMLGDLPNNTSPRGYMTLAKTMEISKKSRSTIYNLINRGKLKSIGFRPTYILISSVEDLKKQEEDYAKTYIRCYTCCAVKLGTKQRYEDDPKPYCDLCFKQHEEVNNKLQTYIDMVKKFPNATISIMEAASLLGRSKAGVIQSMTKGDLYGTGEDGNPLLADILKYRKVLVNRRALTKEILAQGIKVSTLSETAKQLERTKGTVTTYIQEGKLKAYDTDPVYIVQSDIDRILKERKK